MVFHPRDFIKDLTIIFPWYRTEELEVWLNEPGLTMLPVDLGDYLLNREYFNSLSDIRNYLSTPDKPIGNTEICHFWMRLTTLERIEFRFADLKG